MVGTYQCCFPGSDGCTLCNEVYPQAIHTAVFKDNSLIDYNLPSNNSENTDYKEGNDKKKCGNTLTTGESG